MKYRDILLVDTVKRFVKAVEICSSGNENSYFFY